MKIIIMGAGIAGLTFGIACRRFGFDVRIYEKHHELRNLGGGLILWPHGLRYLDWMGVGHCLQPYKIPINRCNIMGLDGTRILSEDCADFSKVIDGDILPIERHYLQNALRNQLPPSSLVMGKKCIAVQSSDDCATAFFADGTQDEADLIVGADGIHSSVRTFLYPDFLPSYTDLCWWGGVVDKKYLPNFSVNESYCVLSLGKTGLIWPVKDEKFLWYIPVKMPAAELIKSTDGLEQIRHICHDWSQDIQSVLSAPTTSQNFHLAIFTLPPRPHWSKGRITLIGDAIHALGPIMAQGTSLAIEDAFLLSLCLQQSEGDLPATLKHYESLRFPKYQQLYEFENQTAAMMTTDCLTDLELLQNQLKNANLVLLYKDLIPLINKEASLTLVKTITNERVLY